MLTKCAFCCLNFNSSKNVHIIKHIVECNIKVLFKFSYSIEECSTCFICTSYSILHHRASKIFKSTIPSNNIMSISSPVIKFFIYFFYYKFMLVKLKNVCFINPPETFYFICEFTILLKYLVFFVRIYMQYFMIKYVRICYIRIYVSHIRMCVLCKYTIFTIRININIIILM